MNWSKFIVSNQKEESISIQRVYDKLCSTGVNISCDSSVVTYGAEWKRNLSFTSNVDDCMNSSYFSLRKTHESLLSTGSTQEDTS